jgi:hypothetical protein
VAQQICSQGRLELFLSDIRTFRGLSKKPSPPNYCSCSGDVCGFEDSVNSKHFRPNKRPRLEYRVTKTSLNKRHHDLITVLDSVQLQWHKHRVTDYLFYWPKRKSPATLIVSIVREQGVVQLPPLVQLWRSQHHVGFSPPQGGEAADASHASRSQGDDELRAALKVMVEGGSLVKLILCGENGDRCR